MQGNVHFFFFLTIIQKDAAISDRMEKIKMKMSLKVSTYMFQVLGPSYSGWRVIARKFTSLTFNMFTFPKYGSLSRFSPLL